MSSPNCKGLIRCLKPYDNPDKLLIGTFNDHRLIRAVFNRGGNICLFLCLDTLQSSPGKELMVPIKSMPVSASIVAGISAIMLVTSFVILDAPAPEPLSLPVLTTTIRSVCANGFAMASAAAGKRRSIVGSLLLVCILSRHLLFVASLAPPLSLCSRMTSACATPSALAASASARTTHTDHIGFSLAALENGCCFQLQLRPGLCICWPRPKFPIDGVQLRPVCARSHPIHALLRLVSCS